MPPGAESQKREVPPSCPFVDSGPRVMVHGTHAHQNRDTSMQNTNCSLFAGPGYKLQPSRATVLRPSEPHFQLSRTRTGRGRFSAPSLLARWPLLGVCRLVTGVPVPTREPLKARRVRQPWDGNRDVSALLATRSQARGPQPSTPAQGLRQGTGRAGTGFW